MWIETSTSLRKGTGEKQLRKIRGLGNRHKSFLLTDGILGGFMKNVFLILSFFLAQTVGAAQHDYNIANSSGAAVRSDINDALSAIVSNNSGTSAPSTTFAYQLWADTTTGLLKIRNAANSAWVSIGTLASTGLGLVNQVDEIARNGGTVGGTADAITLTPSPAITSYATLQSFRFVATGTNTTAATVNVSGLGVKNIKNVSGGALIAGVITSGRSYELTYDGTNFVLSERGVTAQIFARYSNSSLLSVSDSTRTIVNFGTSTYDSNSAVTTGSSWKFTAPYTGRYRVTAAVEFDAGAGWNAGEQAYMSLHKNGASGITSGLDDWFAETTTSRYVKLKGSDTILLTATDYIDVRVYQTSGASRNIVADARENYISIEFVGN